MNRASDVPAFSAAFQRCDTCNVAAFYVRAPGRAPAFGCDTCKVATLYVFETLSAPQFLYVSTLCVFAPLYRPRLTAAFTAAFGGAALPSNGHVETVRGKGVESENH